MANEFDRVLVTGISGFLGKHVALAALREGFLVRGTVRSGAKAREVMRTLTTSGADPSRVEFVEADLLRDDGWAEAVAGCRFATHIASPFPRRIPRDRLGLVEPAREGTLRVLRAAKMAGVERVVVTSSVAAVYYGHPHRNGRPFTEDDFSDTSDPALGAYALSKTLAEKAAWAFSETERLDLATINPSVIFGPVLDAQFGTSVGILRAMRRGRMPFLANMHLGVVDVRDVAAAHIRALLVPAAVGGRFIASAGSLSLARIAAEVARVPPPMLRRFAPVVLPDAAVRVAALILPEAKQALAELGQRKTLVADRAKEILGVSFRSPEDAIRATIESLAAHGLG